VKGKQGKRTVFKIPLS